MKNANISQTINSRYNMMMLDTERAQDESGVDGDEKITFEDTEQGNSRRALLRVEKLAMRDKELNKKSEQHYINGIRDLVHESLLVRFKSSLEDTDHLYKKVLGFDENLPALLDMLTVKAASISKIEPLAAAMPWLYEDLIKMVNTPKYRRVDAKGKVIPVETLRVALSFLGIENLKIVVPSLAFRRWIPQITDPYPKIKTRIWEEALAVAISAKKIAELSQVEPSHAFILGLFHDVGRILVVRLYFRLFDQVQQEALVEAHNDKKKEEHAALTKIVPSTTFLNFLLEEYATKLSSRMIERMGMQRIFIAAAMQEFSDSIAAKDALPMTNVLFQANAYAKYRMLKGYKLISLDESKDYLRQYAFPAGALGTLKATDLRHLNLSLEED